MTTRRQFLKVGAALGTSALIRGLLDPTDAVLFTASRTFASVQIPQTPLPGRAITQFVDPLPVFGPAGIPRVTGPDIPVGIEEIQQQVLPASFYAGLASPYRAGTYVWGYRVGNSAPSYPGVTIEAKRQQPTTVTYVNNLPIPPVLQKYLTIDQTLHWANPLGLGDINSDGMADIRDYGIWRQRFGATNCGNPADLNGDCLVDSRDYGIWRQHFGQTGPTMSKEPFAGPPPTVVHLHGGEVPSDFDGGPDQWFTPNGLHGAGYRSLPGVIVGANGAVYQYPNTQEATTLWIHDHTLGATRVNVYAGLAAFYLLRDDYDTGLPNNKLNLPAGHQEIELVLQDRQFDTNGQWFWPDGSGAGLNGSPPNPGVHPFWIPEFFGDAIVVNGKTWPYLTVEPRRYRFRFLNGANARFFELRLVNRATEAPGPACWQIGTDGGLLDKPVVLNAPNNSAPTRLLLAPGERADIIIDFAGFAGQTLTLLNSAKAPFPSGTPPHPQTTGQVMQFRVGTSITGGNDTAYNPASGAPLRGGLNQQPAIVRLANPATGTLAGGVTPAAKRQLVLVEVEGPGGPVEAFLNNTEWNGLRDILPPPVPPVPVPGSKLSESGEYMTELPRVGSTELWEIINTTGDAHPIHVHLVQFQLVNRQPFQNAAYRKAYDSLFPGGRYAGIQPDGTWGPVTYPPGVFIPGYGPPQDYNTPNADSALGGNPAVGPYLQGPVRLPEANEAGWKDTIQMYPGQVTRLVIRWAPPDTSVNGVQPGQNLYAFDPTKGPGYAWHCHILDHEDNEMMRPYIPVT